MGLNQDVSLDRIESAILFNSFADALSELRSKKYKIISLAQNADLRIRCGSDSYISQHGNWVKEAVLYTPNGFNKLIRLSPIVRFAKEATKLDRQGKEFYPTEKHIERILEDSIDYPQDSIEIPTNRFGLEALTIWAFGGEKEARDYGKFLEEAGISKLPISVVGKDYVNKQEKPFVRQIYLRNLEFHSQLDGSLKNLFVMNRMRGIINKK